MDKKLLKIIALIVVILAGIVLVLRIVGVI